MILVPVLLNLCNLLYIIFCVFDKPLCYLSTTFIYIASLLIHSIYSELEREIIYMIVTPQFIFDFHELYTSLQTLIDTGLYRDSNCKCSMSSYMIFPHTSISFCCSKFGSFGHTYTIFTHIFNQFYGSQSVNFNSKLLSYLYWLINMIKTNCILSLPCPRAHLDSKISRYWLTDESFLTFGYDLISRKKEILSNTDTFDIFCGVCNSSLCDNCSDAIFGYTSGINLKNTRLITNTNTKLSMIMLDSGASLACTPF